MLQDAWVGSEVGQDHVVGSEELQIDLRVVFVAPGPGIERSVEPGPVSCPVTELHVVPDLGSGCGIRATIDQNLSEYRCRGRYDLVPKPASQLGTRSGRIAA